MKTPRHFRDALDCFPPEAAAELLDHLEEARLDGLQSGLAAADAEQRALDSLGDLTRLKAEMETATACPWWVRRNLSLRERLLASGWLALGLYVMSGICTHPDPDYTTIIGSLGVGLCCVVMGLGLLRWHDRIRLWVTGSAVLLALTTSVPTRVRAANIVEIAAGNPNFSTLVAAVQAAGLVDTLSGPGPFTVFAPTDVAFAKLPEGTIPALLADTNRLRQVLLYHVVGAAVPSASVVSGPVVTVQGAAVTASVTGEGVRINGAQVVTPDIAADNGIIHVIDDVLLPPPTILETALATPQLSTLVTAVQAAGLVEAFQANTIYTVFAPTDAAFAKLPEGTIPALLADTNRLRNILLTHVIQGPRLRASSLTPGAVISLSGSPLRVVLTNGLVVINGATVTSPDIEGLNGVIHVVDEVILPGAGFDGLNPVISKAGDSVTVVWPDVVGGTAVLERSGSLLDPQWSPVTATPLVADGVRKVTLPATADAEFFRVEVEVGGGD